MIIPITSALDSEEVYGIIELQGSLTVEELAGLDLGELHQASEVFLLLSLCVLPFDSLAISLRTSTT